MMMMIIIKNAQLHCCKCNVAWALNNVNNYATDVLNTAPEIVSDWPR